MRGIRGAGSIYTKMSVVIALMLTVLTLAVGAILYYWCFYTYGHTFEDYTIDSATDQETLNRGIKNEWVLGVSAHSIDLVDAVIGDEASERVLEQAEQQVEAAKVYREAIDGKYYLYRIEVNTSGGERIYHYSVIKDIYLEHFPQMAASMVAIAVGAFLVTLLIVKRMTQRMANTIAKTSRSIQNMARDIPGEALDLSAIEDQDLVELVKAYQSTKSQLDEQRSIQQSMLQYISHELKTPVMIIKTYADSARQGIFPKGSLDSSLDVIENQTDRIKARVADLLMVTKMETEYSNEGPSVVDMSAIVEAQCDALGSINRDKQVHVSVDDDLTLFGIRSQLQVLVENLLTNQFRYAKSSVSVVGRREPTEIVIDFSNDGPLIPSEKRDEFFSPFAKGPDGGTGLGLTICKRVAALHGGSLSLLPDAETTTFEVRLPNETTLPVPTDNHTHQNELPSE